MPETCAHYWVIEPPDGPISKGTCKVCGAEKEFGNIPPITTVYFGKTPPRYKDLTQAIPNRENTIRVKHNTLATI